MRPTEIMQLWRLFGVNWGAQCFNTYLQYSTVIRDNFVEKKLELQNAMITG